MGIELKFEKFLVSPAACGGIGTKSPATLRNHGCESRKVRGPLLGSSAAIEKSDCLESQEEISYSDHLPGGFVGDHCVQNRKEFSHARG